jgi:hypothetical protein
MQPKIKIEDGAPKSNSSTEFDLDSRIYEINPDYVYSEFDSGEDVGSEVLEAD